MLIQFNFKNFKSFREEATLDLSAAKMTEFSDRVVTIGSEKILPVAAIYGANASGKSNIYNAFEYMSHYVAESFRYGGEEEEFEQFRPTPFLFDSTSEEAESSFEVYFTLSGDKAEKTYRDALLIYPNNPGMILGLASTLALKGNTDEAIELMERGLPLSINEKQKATVRATLCFLYLKAGREDKASRLATELPHTRESREVIQPLIQQRLTEEQINEEIKRILLGDEKRIG